MAIGPGYIGQSSAFGAPGTSGSLSSVFSDQAKLYQMKRLEEEEKAQERQDSQMSAIANTGKMAINQAEFAGKSRELQQAQLSDMQSKNTLYSDQFRNVQMDPNANIYDKAKATFSTQGVEPIPGTYAEKNNMSPGALSLGMQATPGVVKNFGAKGPDYLDSLIDQGFSEALPQGVDVSSGMSDTFNKAGDKLGAAAGKTTSALSTGMNVAGGVAGVAGAVGGAQKIAQSETGKGKAGGALQMAGGLGAAGVAAGLVSGPVGWASLGASLLGGFLND